MQKTGELVIITKTYDLILWSCNHTKPLSAPASLRTGRTLLGLGAK